MSLLHDFALLLGIGACSGLLAGLFGVGGGVVLVPALVLFFAALGVGGDWVTHLAVGTSLATIIGTGVMSTLSHQRHGGVRWDLVARLAPGIVLGAWLGAALAGVLPEPWLKRFFALFLATIGARMLLGSAQREPRHPLPDTAGLWGMGALIGGLSALVGIGGGSLTVPFLHRHGVALRAAVGTSAACGLPIASAGALGFAVVGWGREGLPPYTTGFIHWPAALTILLASMPLAPLGARLAHRLPVGVLRRLFGALLVAMALHLGLSG
ncbi:MAG: sulfite exporter TauE/SafE family protein [Chromatiaceae bacterium]|nr:sulfite exporter TauE/SafE family protein [Chromatiaceae bacterium]